jgi:putative transposase
VTSEPSKRAEEGALRDGIAQISLDCAGSGSRRVTHALQRAGWKVNHKRVLRLMRDESVVCQLTRHCVQTTDLHQHFPIDPTVVNGPTPAAPEVIWVADLTSIRMQSECVSLATILDASSRRCSGWHVSRRMDTHWALGALQEA